MGALQLKKPRCTLDDIQQDYILNGILDDKSLKTITKELGIPLNWVADFAAIDPFFDKRLRNIREAWIHAQVETLIGITRGCETMAQVSAAKVESENIKWSASKIIPLVYSENLNVNVNHTLDLSSVLLAAENRVLPLLQAKSVINTLGTIATVATTHEDAPGSTIDVDCIVRHEPIKDAIVLEDLF